MSAMGITRSGRVYQGPELADKGKTPAAAFRDDVRAAPALTKKVSEEEAEAFMKVIKASEYKVVEQMGKSSAHISLLALLLSSEPHRDALLKVLTAAQVLKETAPERIEETVSSIFSNQISFFEDEIPSEGQGHLRALHIVCKCNNHVVGRVMIDNGSALNVCLVSTLKQMNVDMSRIRGSKTTIRAFDGSRRDVNGEIDLLIDVGPCSFSVTFQILEIPNAFSLLLGRPRIHAAEAVPSSLHQKLKFFVEGKLITVNGEEDYAIYKETAVPYVSIDEDQNLPFHSFDTISAIRDYGEVGPSRADRMIGKVLLKSEYIPGTGLGARAQGILHPVQFFSGLPLVIGGTSDDIPTESEDSSPDMIDAPFVLSDVYAIIEETSSKAPIRLAQENQGLNNWTAIPCYSAIVVDVLQSNPNHGSNDSNPLKTRLGKSLPIYFREGLDENGRVPEIEESLHRLENHQLTSVEPTEDINIGNAEEPRTLRIGTGLDPAQRARMIDFLTEYQEEEIIKQVDARFLEICNYSEWVANIVPVEKKNGKVRVCIDYRDLNRASPKDNFPLPHIDVLVDNTACHTQFSFMDGFSGYNQIQMAEEDKVKTTFITMWGTFCYKVMPFGLKNARATYQRAMVTLFHDMMHKKIEVYVDDMIAKSKEGEDHLVNLKQLFDRLRKYKLQLNPGKCTFSVKSRKLLGFIVSEKGIEVDPDKVKAIMELPPPSTVHEQYTLYHTVRLLSKTDPLKYLLGSPSSMRNIAKWRCQLTEYDIEYVSRTSVKGQAIADHLAEFPIVDDTPINFDFPNEGILQMNCEEEVTGWKMYFDGAVNSAGSGIGAVLISSEGRHFPIAAKIDFP
ncbi:hypothetical protein CRG98_013002 [Punica granatum]|uniref:Reverse transcriptase domain-containing protein n=1 Tax=Punica granatum TaxID=22663 RepID=A0A2I0KEH7_PUNGR|nr:hypothetical protein CRG98_013002 [Punica granatum]